MAVEPETYVGKGLYTVRDVSRLARTSSQNIRRWIDGYVTRRNGRSIRHEPVLCSDYGRVENELVLSFLDLMQVRMVLAFKEYGVSLQEIRKAAIRAAEVLNDPHPFATERLYTDGRRVLAEITGEGRDPDLITLSQRQYEIHEVVIPLLYKGVEFNRESIAMRWWPHGTESPVVVDPDRNFGRPTVASCGVPAEILAQQVSVIGSIESVASWYEVSQDEVRAALDFERDFAA